MQLQFPTFPTLLTFLKHRNVGLRPAGSQVNRIKLLIFIEHNSQAIDLWDDFWPRPNYFANPTYGDYGDWLNIVVNQVTR